MQSAEMHQDSLVQCSCASIVLLDYNILHGLQFFLSARFSLMEAILFWAGRKRLPVSILCPQDVFPGQLRGLLQLQGKFFSPRKRCGKSLFPLRQ